MSLSVASATEIVFHREESTQTIVSCGGPAKCSPRPAGDLRDLYELGTYPDRQPKLTIARVMDDGTITTPSELHPPL